ncbi:MAG: hypothetical protein KY395_04905 [Actinobacteria bacterium]|nr:hypothetical protein [Actinomycetota bacterium]
MGMESSWAATLAAGLVVAIVAVVLLQLLLNRVYRIERAALDVWTEGKKVAGNTSTAWILDDISKRLGDLADEATDHERLLTEGGE